MIHAVYSDSLDAYLGRMEAPERVHFIATRPDGRVAGLFGKSNDEILADLGTADAVFQSFLGDINAAVAHTSQVDAPFGGVIGAQDPLLDAKLMSLQMDYGGGFLPRWNTYYQEQKDAIIMPGEDNLPQFKAEYNKFRARFEALGYKPTMDPPADPTEWWKWAVYGGLALAVIAIFAPFILGPLTAAFVLKDKPTRDAAIQYVTR